MKRRVVAAILGLCLLLGLIPATIIAVNDPSLEVTQTATNLDENFISQVTMTFPSVAYSSPMDIVFVLDGSTSSDQTNFAQAAAKMLTDLADVTGLEINAGLVIFGGEVPILYESPSLADLSNETALECLTTAMTDKSYDGVTGRSGSNLQAGIEAARDLLAGGSSAAENKYMILLTDGGARMWINNNGKAVAQKPYKNCWNTNEDFRYRHVGDSEPTFSSETRPFEEVFSAGEAGKIGEYAITKEQYEPTKDTDENRVSTLSGGTIDVNTSPNYYTNLESATYFAAESIIEASEEANVIWVDYPYYKDSKFEEYTDSFKSWLATNNYITRYDSTDSTADPFEQIKNSLVYYVGEGSTVENVIGYGTDNDGNYYDFEMVNLDQMKLTVGTTEYNAVKISDTEYGFGDQGNGTYLFKLTYYPDGYDYFELAIQTSVTPGDTVKLDYQVHLTNPQEDDGTYGVYDEDGSEQLTALRVSHDATLYPVDSNGTSRTQVPFPLPTVSYTVEVPKIVTLNVAPITVYVGGDGYESVVVDQAGATVGAQYNTLPEPGYTVDLPEDVGKALKEAIGVPETTTLDLSKYLKFTYDDGNGTTRVWTLEPYDQNEGNNSMVNGRYLYRLVPGEGQDAIRLQFIDSEGNLSTNDNFVIDQSKPNQEYTISVYPGALDQGLVKAEIEALTGKYSVSMNPATMKIRGVVSDEAEVTTEIVNNTPASPVDKMTAQVPEGTKYYYKTFNDESSGIQVADGSAVQLLVDDVLPSATATLEASAVTMFSAVLPDDYNIEMCYLDLVYTKNSNAVVAASNPVTVYWPYPSVTNQSTEFFIVHYQGLNRNDEEALTDDYTMQLYSADSQDNGFKLENTAQGIKFTVDSFSPFALFWASNDGGHDEEPISTGSLKITKTVTGDGDRTEYFTFTVTFTNGSSQLGTRFSYSGSKHGTIQSGESITMKHGQSITISGIPAGTHYTVTEAEVDDYNISADGDTGIIRSGKTAVAAFVNDLDVEKPDTPSTPGTPNTPNTPNTSDTPDVPSDFDVPETGDTSKTGLWALLTVVSLVGFFLLTKKKLLYRGKYVRKS